jgi:hypothetical protein
MQNADNKLTDSELQATIEIFLRSPDKAAEWLTLADKYAQAYLEDPKIFLLPTAHGFLKPIIERYANDLEGLAQYIETVRDAFDRRSAQWLAIQRVYRRINGRHVQQLRRSRSNRAVEKAIELFGSVDYQTRLQWVANLENDWAKRRLVFLDAQRDKFKGGRISVEDRVELLAEFWNDIDTEIYEGRLKKWN